MTCLLKDTTTITDWYQTEIAFDYYLDVSDTNGSHIMREGFDHYSSEKSLQQNLDDCPYTDDNAKFWKAGCRWHYNLQAATSIGAYI